MYVESTDDLSAYAYDYGPHGMSKYLTSIDWQYLLSVNLTANSLWAAFPSVLLEAVELHVPSVIMKCNGAKCSRHYPKEIRKALARKRCVWRKSRLEPSTPCYYKGTET